MKVKIFGYGEIGQSLAEVYRSNGIEIGWKDLKGKHGDDDCELLNVCIPFNQDFAEIVIKEINESNAQYVVIHSTVSPGTTTFINNNVSALVCHSPVIGVHPNLARSLITFDKWFGGGEPIIFEHFRSIHISSRYLGPPEATEIMKIWDTTYYGMCLGINAEVKEMLEKYGIPYDRWVDYLKAYNKGYRLMGVTNVQRPYFESLTMPIGGHCVAPNHKILHDFLDHDLLEGLFKKYT